MSTNKQYNTVYFLQRNQWRHWLSQNYKSEPEIWLIYPKKKSGKPRIIYNDAVEEALCYGWIDSTIKTFDAVSTMQKFSPRRPGSSFSQANKERLHWLMENNLVHPDFHEEVLNVLSQSFVFPGDILSAVRKDKEAWTHFQTFSLPYKRIRIAYIESARKRPGEFERRLRNFIEKTRSNKLIRGYGGIEKYY